MYDIIIIGSGPAGLTAAIYAKRAMLNAVVVEKDYMGTGQISVSERVDNYPGLYGISGYDLGEKFYEHAKALGTEFYEGEAKAIKKSGDGWTVVFENEKALEARAVIYAAGTSYRRLDVPGGEKQCVSYCAVCDGAFYQSKTVAVIGGGDTALGDAVYLSKIAKRVYLIHRRDEFRANKSLQAQVSGISNIEPIMNTVVKQINGGDRAEELVIEQNGRVDTLKIDGVFCALGSLPNTEILKGICSLDESGYVIAGEDGVTDAKGLFAVGDVRTTPLRQVITAAADGANAAISAEKLIRSI
ncbi:MAG: FAD-dependent oxidoreductase [Ruminococcus sp.]|nr:FAD-dependent oxidoreductase [Ruminococcus sp.]